MLFIHSVAAFGRGSGSSIRAHVTTRGGDAASICCACSPARGATDTSERHVGRGKREMPSCARAHYYVLPLLCCGSGSYGCTLRACTHARTHYAAQPSDARTHAGPPAEHTAMCRHAIGWHHEATTTALVHRHRHKGLLFADVRSQQYTRVYCVLRSIEHYCIRTLCGTPRSLAGPTRMSVHTCIRVR
jgi:hypothetical protein